MDSRDLVMVLAAIILFLGVAYLIYDYGMSISEHHEEHEEHEMTEAEELYFKALEFDPGESYSRTYSLDADGLEKTVELAVDGETKYLGISTIFHIERLYYLDNEMILCIKHEKKDYCSVVEDQELKDYFSSRESNFPTAELSAEEKELHEFLFEKGALTISEEVEEQEVGEFGCSLIKSEIDFTKLTIDELEEIGLNANSPEVVIYSDYSNIWCIDEDGDRIFQNFTYSVYGVEKYVTRTLLEKEEAGEIEAPEELVEESKIIELYNTILSTEEAVYECLYSEDSDNCFKEEGVYSNKAFYCMLAGSDKDNCLAIVASSKIDITLCPEITNSSIKDDCYFEIAVILEDPTICESVDDIVKAEECTELATAEEENP